MSRNTFVDTVSNPYLSIIYDEAILLLLGVPQTVSSLLGVGVTVVELF